MVIKGFLYRTVNLFAAIVVLTGCAPTPANGTGIPLWAVLCVPLIIIIVIIVAATIFIRRNKRKNEVSPNNTSETRSSNLPADNQPKPALTRSPDNSQIQSPNTKTSGPIFISYRRSDSDDIAGRIYDRLINKFGANPIFKDVDSIPLGFDFKEYLDRKVSECNVLLAIIGDRWLDARDTIGKKRLEDPADFVRIEIESALERGIPVIPLLVRGAQMPLEENLPLSLRKLVYRNGIQIRPDPDFHRDMDRLISALEKYIQ
jgi:hypothetical protein